MGVTRDCFQRKVYRPASVDVYLLDPLRSTEVVKILNEMKRDSDKSNPGDPDSMKPFFAAYERFEKAIASTTSLGHVKSDKTGAFSFHNLEPGMRLLVIGTSEREDEATFYAVQEIETLHRGRNSIILNFDREEVCR